MKIYLINAPYTSERYNPIRIPPIGILYLSNTLNKNFISHNCLDLGYYSYEKCIETIENIEYADFYGISFFQESYSILNEMVTIIKNHYPNSKIILGGLFSTAVHKEILEDNEKIDFIVRGEGEKALIKIFNNDFNEDDGISYRIGNNIFLSNKINHIENLDEIGSLIIPDEMKFRLRESDSLTNVIPIVWSRGCNNACSFCTIRTNRNLWRCRSISSVVNEIKDQYNTSEQAHIFFFDANPMANISLFRNLIRTINKNFPKITFSCAGTVDIILNNKDIILEFKKMGLKILEIGIESFNDKILSYYNKKTTREKNIECLKFCKQNGIKVDFDYILYNPRLTYQELIGEIKILKKMGFNENLDLNALFSNLKLYSGTQVRSDFEERKQVEIGFKIIPSVFDYFEDEKVKKAYLRVSTLKQAILEIYKNSVITEKIQQNGKNFDRDANQIVQILTLLNLQLKIYFFEAYWELILNNIERAQSYEEKISKIFQKYDTLSKKIDKRSTKYSE